MNVTSFVNHNHSDLQIKGDGDLDCQHFSRQKVKLIW